MTMTKKTSLILGVVATTTWLTMLYLIIRSFIWLRNPGLDINEPGYGNGFLLLLLLFYWIVWIVFTGFTLFMAIGIPHYFYYIHDKHRVSYIYLVKYISVVPLIILGISSLIVFDSLKKPNSGFELQHLIGLISICIGLSTLLIFTHTAIDTEELNKPR